MKSDNCTKSKILTKLKTPPIHLTEFLLCINLINYIEVEVCLLVEGFSFLD
jgi:hypothetical protein